MMKNLLFPMLLMMAATVSAQNCVGAQSQIDLHTNNILARMTISEGVFQSFIPSPSNTGNGPSTIYRASLWLAGIDSTGNLHMNVPTYNNSGSPLGNAAGPLSPEGVADTTACSNWDKQFRVTSQRIMAFQNALPILANNPAQAETLYPEIMGWPGRNNPFFVDIWGFELPTDHELAPFADADQDGIYNPLKGDYPAVTLRLHAPFVPTEIVWCVYNDVGNQPISNAFPVEFQETSWAFNLFGQAALNNTIFTSHKLIFRTDAPYDSCFMAMWVDFDLGCSEDDYVGSAPDLDAFYAYNQDAIDGNANNMCNNGGVAFSGKPPVQSVTFLDQSLDKCMYYNNGASTPPPFQGSDDPGTIAEYYNLFNAHWRDGTPLTYGGNGHLTGAPTNYAFPDDPADANGWSMHTANLPSGDRRMLGIHQLGQVMPGQVEEFTVAWTAHPNPNLPNGIGTTYTDISTIRNYFNSTLTSTSTPLPEASVILSPNPANNVVTLNYSDLDVVEMRCFDATGRLVRRIMNLPVQEYTLDVTGWQNGTYTVQLLTRQGSVARKLVVMN